MDENTEISREQAADLAALGRMAGDEIDPLAPVDAAESKDNQAPAFDAAAAWAELPAMFGGVLAMAMPEMKQVYTEEACKKWGEKMAPFAAERGWDVEKILGTGVQLAVVTGQLGFGTICVVRHYRAKAKAEAKLAENVQAADQVGDMTGTQPTVEGAAPDANQ